MSESHKVMPLAVILLACTIGSACDTQRANPHQEATLPATIGSLAIIKGAYLPSKSVRGDYILSGGDSVFRVLAEFRHDAVRALVACLDDERPSHVTLNSRYVPVGVLCSEGLARLVYYEPVDTTGGLDADWPGFLLPNSTPAERRRAKQAWKGVIEQHLYRLTSEM